MAFSLPGYNATVHVLQSRMYLLPLVLALAVLARILYVARTRQARLPPGPRTSWLGSVNVPREYQWLTYAHWKKTYGTRPPYSFIDVTDSPRTGDIIYIRVLGNPIIVLNSAEAVNDLFEKRSANYSSRPVRVMVNEL